MLKNTILIYCKVYDVITTFWSSISS